jgi:uncharacterized protein YggE
VTVARATPGEALADLSERTAALGTVLDAAGIPAEDRQTSDLSLHPDHGERSHAAHRASSSVTVTVADFELAARLVGQAGQAVGDALTVSNLRWQAIDIDKAQRAARRLAVDAATDIARQLADAAGVTLAEPRSVCEPPAGQPVSHRLSSRGGQARLTSIQLNPGDSDISVAIEAIWNIAPPSG